MYYVTGGENNWVGFVSMCEDNLVSEVLPLKEAITKIKTQTM